MCVCVYVGRHAYESSFSTTGLEYFFYLEDTECPPLQTARIVLEGTIKIAAALISAPEHIWINDKVRHWKNNAIQNINNILKLYKQPTISQ